MEIKYAVVAPTHNRSETFLPECIESVRASEQDHDPDIRFSYRHVIVNDASTDNTREYLDAEAANDPNLVFARREENGGAGAAFDDGYGVLIDIIRAEIIRRPDGNAVERVAPDLIVPLDDDDRFLRHTLRTYTRTIVEDIRANPGQDPLELLFGRVVPIDAAGTPTYETGGIDYNDIEYAPGMKFYDLMRKGNQIPSAAVAVGFLALGGQRLRHWGCQDWALALGALSTGIRHTFIADPPLAEYRIHQGQASLQHRLPGDVWDIDAQRVRSTFPPSHKLGTGPDPYEALRLALEQMEREGLEIPLPQPRLA